MSHPDKPELSIPVFPLNTDGIDVFINLLFLINLLHYKILIISLLEEIFIFIMFL